MSKSVFHTITIKVPSEQLYKGRNGTLTIVPTLTKKNALTKRLGIPSIILKKDDHIVHPVIEEEGKVQEYKGKEKRVRKPRITTKKEDEQAPAQETEKLLKVNFFRRYLPVLEKESEKLRGSGVDFDYKKKALEELYNIRKNGNVSDEDMERWGNRWMEIRNSLYKFSDKGYGKKFMNNVKDKFFT